MISATEFTLTGPWRSPVQMLADQSYSGHVSVHDDEAAAKLGLAGAPIEGPTHFTQFEPLLAALWGERWFSQGCLSAHFQTMVIEGEQVQASVTSPGPGADMVRIDAVKNDGAPVLTGTASVGDGPMDTELSQRMQRALDRPPASLQILDQIHVGQRGARAEELTVRFDDHLGNLYPFSLADKLSRMTETLAWQQQDTGHDSPWGAPVVPAEMLSVLTGSGSGGSGFVTRQPSLGLFIDLEVRLLGTPVLVGKTYRMEREVVAMGESRRTESYWTKTHLVDVDTGVAVAHVLLHSGVFKDSYPGYIAS